MNNVFLLTGGNMGDRRQNLLRAAKIIDEKVGKILSTSAIYETEAWGKIDQSSFYNQVLQVLTDYSPKEVLQEILAIELNMGRERIVKYGPRLIDIDILFYNNEVIETPELIVPHPQIQHRRFVLAPLAELVPEFVHPYLQKTIRELLIECEDPLTVKAIS
jgi:2-amino-4-hydroxy-6-hydroxymethyldihydropteridine diphosphokinase